MIHFLNAGARQALNLLKRGLPLPVTFAVAAIFVAIVGFVDFLTGVEVRVFPLYFLPVAFVAWHASARWGLVFAVLGGLLWFASNLLGGKVYSSALIWISNTAVQIVAFSCIALLIGELRHRLAVEEALSRTDSLTSLPNGRAFYERAEAIVALERRSLNPTTFAYLDLDNFKSVNDLYGHQQGDEVLRQVAAVFQRETRSSDLIARMGGDEFILLLPNTGPEGAADLLRRVCLAAARDMQLGQWPVTVSIGAVTFLHAPEAVEAGVQRTDSAMYEAKRRGKNQVYLEVVPPEAGEGHEPAQ